jgi:hypothetical protein
MPHAMTEDHSAEDSQIRHAAAIAAWPSPALDPRSRVPAGTEPSQANAGEAGNTGCQCD